MKGSAGIGSVIVRIEGVAATSATPDDALDRLVPARTVRRALADASLKATEVSSIVVTDEAARIWGGPRAFARRALGPTGDVARVSAADAEEVLGTACREADRGPGLAIAVLDRDGATIALCLQSEDRRTTGLRAR